MDSRLGAIVLTDGSSLAAVTTAYLDAHPGRHFTIGGPAAWPDPSAIAIAGADLYATSAGAADEPMLLLNPAATVAEPIAAYLATHAGRIGAVRVFGGAVAVPGPSLTGVARVLTGSYFPPIFGSG